MKGAVLLNGGKGLLLLLQNISIQLIHLQESHTRTTIKKISAILTTFSRKHSHKTGAGGLSHRQGTVHRGDIPRIGLGFTLS